jgi:hypothetical protein
MTPTTCEADECIARFFSGPNPGTGCSYVSSTDELLLVDGMLLLPLWIDNLVVTEDIIPVKYDKQDQQGKVAFNERSPHPTQYQGSLARSPGGPQT